jgi:hypothetical protein
VTSCPYGAQISVWDRVDCVICACGGAQDDPSEPRSLEGEVAAAPQSCGASDDKSAGIGTCRGFVSCVHREAPPRGAMDVCHGEAATDSRGSNNLRAIILSHIVLRLSSSSDNQRGRDGRHRNRCRQTLRTLGSNADAAYTARSLAHGWPVRPAMI